MGPDGGATTETLESGRVWHDGQIIGIVLAETFEAAREAANKVQVTYQEEAPSATFDSPGTTTAEHKAQKGQRGVIIDLPLQRQRRGADSSARGATLSFPQPRASASAMLRGSGTRCRQ